MSKLARLLATWFGCGYSPFAPGTAGSAAALAIGLALHYGAGFTGWHFAVLAASLFLPGVWAAGVIERESKLKDPSIVVVDEVIGQWIALAGALPFQWPLAVASFFLFRFFDVLKPPPVRQLESLRGGWGINADDVMAGVYAGAVVYAAGRWLG
jgi:phosphatidylglycerophosphatase A